MLNLWKKRLRKGTTAHQKCINQINKSNYQIQESNPLKSTGGQRRLEHSGVKTSRQGTLAPLAPREKMKERSRSKVKGSQTVFAPKPEKKQQVSTLKESIPKPKEKPRAKSNAKIRYRKRSRQQTLTKTRQQKKLTYNII